MNWLPSFVKLFLIFVAGLVLEFGGGIFAMDPLSPYASVCGWLRLLGLALLVISPLLMGLKFFARLDRKTE